MSDASSTSSNEMDSDDEEDWAVEALVEPELPDKPSKRDLDAWCVALSPADLLTIFGPFAPVKLASFSGVEQRPRDSDRFSDWVLVGTVNCFLHVAPRRRERLLAALHEQKKVILPSTYAGVFIQGKAHISMTDLVRAMESAHIRTVRVTSYGIKHSLHEGDMHDMGNAAHRHANTNHFDFGTMWDLDCIVLVKPSRSFKPVRRDMYPMMVPIGQGYGSVNFTVRWPPEPEAENAFTYEIKIYSRVIHLLKASGHKEPKYAPTTIRQLQGRKELARTKLKHLQCYGSSLWGGLRIEATVYAPTLQEASERIEGTPLLDLHTYVNNDDARLAHLQLQCHALTMPQVIENAQRLQRAAKRLPIFYGRAARKTSPLQRKVCRDLLVTETAGIGS